MDIVHVIEDVAATRHPSFQMTTNLVTNGIRSSRWQHVLRVDPATPEDLSPKELEIITTQHQIQMNIVLDLGIIPYDSYESGLTPIPRNTLFDAYDRSLYLHDFEFWFNGKPKQIEQYRQKLNEVHSQHFTPPVSQPTDSLSEPSH